MRPSSSLIALVLIMTALTVLTAVWWPGVDIVIMGLWGIVGIAVLLDIALSVWSKRIEIAFDLPGRGFVGHNVQLSVELSPHRGALPLKMEARLDLEPELVAQDVTTFDQEANRKATTTSSIDIRLTRRGVFKVETIWLKWTSRLKLLEVVVRAPIARKITVAPDISPVLSGAINTQILPLEAGSKDMRLSGQGSEFHQLREFAVGMDTRSIDWKRSARMRSLVVRDLTAERNQQIILCVDSGRLMAEKIAGIAKLDRAINAALATCWAAGQAGDLVGFYNFDSRPRLFLPATPGRAAFTRVQTACATLRYEAHETNHTLGLTYLAGQLKRRSLIIIFSDFVDSTTAELMVETIRTLAKQHFIVYIALSDSSIKTLIEPDILTLDSVARSVAARQISQERRTVLETLSRLGVMCLDSTPEALTSDLIGRYIEIKSREML